MRTLAIGDIHGCLTALETLLETVDLQADDEIVTLGDYIDRGPDTKGVLDRLLALKQSHHLVALRGNHEQMMLDARSTYLKATEEPHLYNPSIARSWLSVGGEEALASYGRGDFAERMDAVPPEHWDFMENQCIDLWETETHFFVHGNAAPDRPLWDQPPHLLYWTTFDSARPHQSGKIMVCGHTTQKNGLPRNLGYAVCIDTWAHGHGWLTALDVRSGRIWQANQFRQHRELQLEDFLEG